MDWLHWKGKGRRTALHPIEVDVFALLLVTFGYRGRYVAACLIPVRAGRNDGGSTIYLAVTVLRHGAFASNYYSDGLSFC